MYAPNNEQCRKELFVEFKKWCSNNCIVVGDFNVTLSNLDVSSNNVFMDVHPGERGYSRRQIVQGKIKQARLDMIFADPELVKKVIMPDMCKMCGAIIPL